MYHMLTALRVSTTPRSNKTMFLSWFYWLGKPLVILALTTECREDDGGLFECSLDANFCMYRILAFSD